MMTRSRMMLRGAVSIVRRRRRIIVWLLGIWNVDIILADVPHVNRTFLLVFGFRDNLEINRAPEDRVMSWLI